MSDLDHTALGPLPPVRRVRKAYEQVHDQLQDLILSGALPQGHRLPTEAQLATRFGVSRATVREALRLLAAGGLVRTAKGTGGGTFVTLPTLDHVQELLQRSYGLLSLTEDVTLQEFLEARALLETFAVRRVAERHTDEQIEALRATLVPEGSPLGPEEQYLHNREFHTVLVDACGNALLRISAQPIFFVLHTHLTRSELSAEFPRKVCADHATILEAIAAGDPDLAEQRMRRHLDGLAEVYAGIWRSGRQGADDGKRTRKSKV